MSDNGQRIRLSCRGLGHLFEPTARRLTKLANNGLVISVAYGPMRGQTDHLWSVDVFNPVKAETFDKPYAAPTFDQAVAIGLKEAEARGWITRDSETQQ